MKNYIVSVDAKGTDILPISYIIKAKNKVEAKRKAIDRLRNKRANFNAYVDGVEE